MVFTGGFIIGFGGGDWASMGGTEMKLNFIDLDAGTEVFAGGTILIDTSKAGGGVWSGGVVLVLTRRAFAELAFTVVEPVVPAVVNFDFANDWFYAEDYMVHKDGLFIGALVNDVPFIAEPPRKGSDFGEIPSVDGGPLASSEWDVRDRAAIYHAEPDRRTEESTTVPSDTLDRNASYPTTAADGLWRSFCRRKASAVAKSSHSTDFFAIDAVGIRDHERSTAQARAY